jgi:hypothetical protein
MIDVDATFKTITSIYKTLTGKSDNDVTLSFETSLGVSKPWKARIDAREIKHEQYDGALTGLLVMLKKELADKLKSAEYEAKRLQQALNQLDN